MADNRLPHKQRSIEKIKNGMVLERLLGHVNGEVELSSTQVSAGIALLKKYLPDTKAIEHGGEVNHNVEIGERTAGNIAKAIAKAITG